MKKIVLLIFISFQALSQIKTGPMIGYTEMREILIWVQTKKSQKVKIQFSEIENPSNIQISDEIMTSKTDGFIAKIILSDLKPGKKYAYSVILDKKTQSLPYETTFKTQALWQYRTDPPNFKVAVGSCVYIGDSTFDRPGRSYGASYEIFKTIADQKPDMMIWGGDNTYYREVDYYTRSGMISRMTHTRAVPEMQELLGSTPNYAIWDDHDYGNNDSDRGFWLKNTALDVFKLFWANPNYVFPNEAITGTTTMNDVQFFFLDDRWWKAPNDRKETGTRDYLGDKQLQWLIDALKSSSASFKIIVNGGQIVNTSKVFENMANYETERATLLDLISKEKIPGVFFISGDRHHSVMHKLEREGTYPLYDLTASPITSGPAKPLKEEYENKTILPETVVEGKRNFATLEFSGPLKERIMKISILDKDGKSLWDKQLSVKDLK